MRQQIDNLAILKSAILDVNNSTILGYPRSEILYVNKTTILKRSNQQCCVCGAHVANIFMLTCFVFSHTRGQHSAMLRNHRISRKDHGGRFVAVSHCILRVWRAQRISIYNVRHRFRHNPTCPIPTFPRPHVPTFPHTNMPTAPQSHVPTVPRSHACTFPDSRTTDGILLGFLFTAYLYA